MDIFDDTAKMGEEMSKVIVRGLTRLTQIKEDARSGISCIKYTAVSTGASDAEMGQTRKPQVNCPKLG